GELPVSQTSRRSSPPGTVGSNRSLPNRSLDVSATLAPFRVRLPKHREKKKELPASALLDWYRLGELPASHTSRRSSPPGTLGSNRSLPNRSLDVSATLAPFRVRLPKHREKKKELPASALLDWYHLGELPVSQTSRRSSPPGTVG